MPALGFYPGWAPGTGAAVSYWRDKAKPIIREVLTETAGKTEPEIKKALHDAYPFGERRYHPYKIWLDEIKRQRSPLAKKGPCACGHSQGAHQGRYGKRDTRCYAADCNCQAYTPEPEGQGRLFA